MRFAPNQAKFSFAGMEFVSKLVEGKFPDYNRVIPKNHKNRVDARKVAAAAEPAARRDPDQRQVQGRSRQHRARHLAHRVVEMPSRKRRWKSSRIDYGGDAIEIGFNVTYLIDALANMGQEMVTVELQDTNSSALITVPDQAGFKYVVMPMRI